MARYDAQINILLSGQKRLEELTGQLYEIEDSITRIQRGWQAASANLNRATKVANVFGRTQPRGEGGRFAPDPDRKQRLAALAAERRARTNARLLRLDLSLAEKRAGYARQELESGSRLIQQTERRVALESRLNSAVTIFQRQQRAFARGGGGARLPQDLQQKAADAQAAFKAAGGPLARNLQLVQALAREMTTIAEAQREINRGSSLSSKGFEAGRRLQERIDVISRQNVVSPEKIRRLRGGATQAIAASFKGDQQEYSEALRRASAAVRRVEEQERQRLRTLKANEKLSSAAVSLEKQKQAALEKTFAVEEKIRSGRKISRSEAADYYFQAQLPRLALPFGDPSAPSMRGGARRTGISRELLGGARTTEEAQATFRAIEERSSKAAKKVKQSFVDAYREMLPPDTLLDGLTALGKTGKTVVNSLEGRAKAAQDIAKENERFSSAAVSLEKQRRAALEKIFAVEEKIRSSRRISRSEAEDYYFQAQLPRLALPFGDPDAPSMRGGARRTGVSRELLGGARTTEEAQAAFRAIEERGSKAAKNIKQSFVKAYQEMLPPDTLLDGLTALGKAGETIAKSLQKRTVTGSGGFAAALPAEEIRKQRNQIIAELRQVAPGVDSAGDNITSTFASSIRDGASSAVAATTTFAEAAKKALKKAFGIASPSRFMIELVRILVDTYVTEMQKSYPRIQAATDKAFGQLTPERSVKKLTATSRGFELSSVPSTQYRALPIRSFDPSGESGEMDEMLRRFRAQIASLTTQPEIYRNLLNALPSSRITTDLIGAANRRATAAELPSFMSTQRMLGPGELEKVIAKAAADYFRTVRVPDPWVGLVGDYRKNFVDKIIGSTQKITAQLALPAARPVAGALPPALFASGLSPKQELRRLEAIRRSDERNDAVMAEDILRGRQRLTGPPLLPPAGPPPPPTRPAAPRGDAASSTGQRNVRQAISDLFDRISTAVRGTFGGGGGFGNRGAGGDAGGAGDPAGALVRTSDAMRRLGSLSSLTNNQLEELEQQFVSLRNQADATGAEFRQLTKDLTRISREQARRDPNADFLTRRFGPRAAQGISEGLIGGAFPLLFGQGAGAAVFGGLGGGLGGFAGGSLGFGLSLLGTALGDVYDRLAQAAQETGKSLNYPIEGFEKLKEAGFFASRQQEYYISKLIESGRTAEATAQIQAEMIRKIGVTGVNDLMRLGDASSDLSKAWAEFNLQLQAALAGPMAGLLEWVTAIVATANQSFRSQRLVEDVSAGLSGKEKERFDFEIDKINRSEQIGQVFGSLFGGLSSQEASKQRNALAKFYEPLAKSAGVGPTKPDPKQQEADLRKAMENAEKIRSLNQQGLNLQRSADELRRNNEDTVYSLRKRAADMEREAADFRRSIEDEIFNKRQELERMLIENDRKRKQNAIDTVDLQLQELASGLDPVAAGVVDAGREYVRFIGEALADKEQRERSLTLDLVQMQREADKFKLQVEDRVRQMNEQRDEFTREVTRTKTQMEFAALDYAKQVEDYRLQMAQRRLELAIEEGNVTKAAAIAAQEGLAVPATGKNYANIGGFQSGRQMLHGIPGYAGFDPSHASETNIHYHFAGKNPAETKAVADYLRGLGYQITEFGQYGQRVGGHARGSQHYREQGFNAFDIPGSSMGGPISQIIEGQKRVHALIGDFLGLSTGARAAIVGTTSAASRGAAGKAGMPVAPTPPPLPALPTAPGAVGISDLLQIDNSAYQKIIAARKEGNKIEEEALQIRIKQAQAALVEKAMQPVKAIEERTQSIYDEIEARKLRNKLTAEGVAPEIIEGMLRAAEIEKEFNQLIAGQDALLEELNKGKRDGATAAYEAALARITELGTIKELTPELLKEKEALEGILRARKAIQDAKPGAIKGAEDAAAASILSPSERIEKEYGDAKQSLEKLIDPVNQVISAAQAIGSAFGSAFSDLITGSTSASEALGRMFRSISESFANMAAQIIAEWIRMQVLGIIKSIFSAATGSITGAASPEVGAIGSGAPIYVAAKGAYFDKAIEPFAIGGVFDSPALERFASGGMFTNSIVSSPTLFKFADGGTMKTGQMGEAGPEAILPLKRGANGQLGVQMVGPARQFAANRATLDSSTSDTSAGDPLMESRQALATAETSTSSPLAESRQALAIAETSIRNRQADRSIEQAFSAPSQALKIQYDSQVINNVEYVTSDQFERGMSQAAERGRALTLGALKNSVKARRQAGI